MFGTNNKRSFNSVAVLSNNSPNSLDWFFKIPVCFFRLFASSMFPLLYKFPISLAIVFDFAKVSSRFF